MNEPKAARIATEKVREFVSREGRIEYEKLKETIRISLREATQDIVPKEQNLIQSPAIRKIAKKKKAASRKWKEARKTGTDEAKAQRKAEFRAKQKQLSEEFGIEEERHYEKLTESGNTGQSSKREGEAALEICIGTYSAEPGPDKYQKGEKRTCRS